MANTQARQLSNFYRNYYSSVYNKRVFSAAPPGTQFEFSFMNRGNTAPSWMARAGRYDPYVPKKAARAFFKATSDTLRNPIHRWMSTAGLQKNLFSKTMRGFAKHPYAVAGTVAAAVGVYTLGKSMMSSLRWTAPEENIQQGAGYGPGYISWSKKTGMPANHLGTRDMMDSLHRMRHSSII